MITPPSVLQTEEIQCAAIAMVVPRSEITQVMGPALTEIFTAIGRQGKPVTGAWFTHHRCRPNENFEMEVCVPIGVPIEPIGRVQAKVLPATTVARTVYQGPYEGLAQAWGEFRAWVAAQGYVAREDLWECYLVGPDKESQPGLWRTELNQPLQANTSVE